MKKLFIFLTVTFLSFSVLADEIKSFDIDGISVGDSLLKYVSKELIENKNKSFYPKSKKYYLIEFNSQEMKFLDNYEFLGVHLKENDNKFLIYSIKGMIEYDNDLESCLKQKKVVTTSIKDTLPGSKEEKYENEYGNIYGQSKAYVSDFKVDGGFVRVWCNDWDKKNDQSKYWIDTIAVDLSTQIFLDWLNTEAYD